MTEKSVAEKLMIKPGRSVLFVNAPENYEKLLGNLPDAVAVFHAPAGEVDIIVAFATSRQELEEQLPRLKPMVKPGGMLWVTYYKGTSRFKTDIHRDSINAYAKTLGMEGVAMISVDADWSALRLKIIS